MEYNGGSQNVEKINSTYARQLKRELKVEILAIQPMNPVEDYIIKFSYTKSDPERVVIISNHISNNYSPYVVAKKNYHWKMHEWSECNHACNGKRFRKAGCFESNSNTRVTDDYCRTSAKPIDDYEECNKECTFG